MIDCLPDLGKSYPNYQIMANRMEHMLGDFVTASNNAYAMDKLLDGAIDFFLEAETVNRTANRAKVLLSSRYESHAYVVCMKSWARMKKIDPVIFTLEEYESRLRYLQHLITSFNAQLLTISERLSLGTVGELNSTNFQELKKFFIAMQEVEFARRQMLISNCW